ncbi:major paralogous domain-containing protein/Por secretion system C-terminal sorting domain-containing protein [Mariniphaga anaerophila]|uniref:Major paralogous domain-containing protein/Por secretion system C-terminal sorting domain-containing protein n=1 Tax=Mariniphaga anaerophila TaxID=1484053 RepID=A0A1M5ETC4_9BACT|nr:FISUMP domain-containing protein [Mariniphaga anaerophila]SHF82523.1 major paralogous domain-containing protein/Por secretion system C-terminal sorting domain-containing protein [Mariniphaga anaerophila]
MRLTFFILVVFIPSFVISQTTGTFIDNRDSTEYKWVKIGDQIWMAENLAYLPGIGGIPVYINQSFAYMKTYFVYNYQGTSVEEAKSTDYFTKYGALYDWFAAIDGYQASNSDPSGIQGACPDGWHIPSRAEWQKLTDFICNDIGICEIRTGFSNKYYTEIGRYLKSETGWEINNGLNSYGFNALPSGWSANSTKSEGNLGLYWTASEYNRDYATAYWLDSNDQHLRVGNPYLLVRNSNSDVIGKWGGFSIRCVCDDNSLLTNNNQSKSIKDNLKINIYPNPSNDGRIFIEISNFEGTGNFTVFNLHGIEINSWEFYAENGSFKKEINLANFAKGIYYFRFSLGEKSLNKTIILY